MAKKSIPTTTSETVVDTPATMDPSAETTEVVKPQSPDVVVSDKFDQIHQKVADLTSTLRELQTHLKSVQKELVKLVKANVKKSKSRASTGGKKTPSGFAKPTKLSDALCDFLAIPHGSELARTEVTRKINAYIKEEKLQDEKDKRIIHPDAKLATVLEYKDGDVVNFFNLQRSLKNCFIKA